MYLCVRGPKVLETNLPHELVRAPSEKSSVLSRSHPSLLPWGLPGEKVFRTSDRTLSLLQSTESKHIRDPPMGFPFPQSYLALSSAVASLACRSAHSPSIATQISSSKSTLKSKADSDESVSAFSECQLSNREARSGPLDANEDAEAMLLHWLLARWIEKRAGSCDLWS